MQDTLIRKLESFEELTDADRTALRAFVPRVRQVPARTDLIQEGDTPGDVHLILNGYACRYKVLPDGQRQIMAFFVPGDFCDLNVFILDQMDHTLGTVSACQVVEIPRHAIEEITAHHPRVTRALMWCALVDEAVLREWLVNIGGRQADQRIAHLFCELLLRLEAVGRVTDNSFPFPFTQTDVADAVGLSDVQVSRTLRELRRLDLITLRHRVLTILDVEQLKAYCGFNPNYLHLRNARWSGRRQLPWLSSVRGD
ncbi:cAMP-binding domain of CRP or a regulatory subunit of cAMP-dependent protein kinases [Methylobacterium phyllostachyos]|uniref:cAMP-binding domain of CRP or a regulatory subunit of cAMP-dependent protein kinases n=1 Tax=Methylobacterium phyllostachyos TaxID=582672 RepID=A0A1H0KVW4_9HYPH|nr:Crp/Fnr family transcriptional regulator [Methylobacterium phyllostachyos]SDO60088.1 cAMP-binding domain of CRP or a regulatory subunit of cAMP-dependent protein kinases [Methylobacterium phyllostachyos]